MRDFMLPQKSIQEFKGLYFKNYKIELTDKEAERRANNLIALYEAVYGDNDFGVQDNRKNKIENYEIS